MDITRQSQRAAEAHERFLFTGERTCIDCHKGIATSCPTWRRPRSRTTETLQAGIEDHLSGLPKLD